ncbi:NADH dehydrogenase subunit M [Sphingobacterium allocomposti]|uniref:NADH dehydrogenase subunit M n=1 Tax=Sphingobacterium allocomposti TaxID=415956 RepID=A0A5S5DFC9_9SPHI|nr:NADH-quinone oxidoreductase subunit M [Sphingobacterium composti Yoo et al. 2007 non Ten et al. 2007]TYP94667.1 NADH dehydrogenase subunit M [Sphingobacterium composti Yoo et al. 2007 non Ten et al. 2007]
MNNLFILLLVPIVSAIVLCFVKNAGIAKWLALAASLLEIGLSVPFLCAFTPDASVQFEQGWTWIASLGIQFHIGIDGISLPLVLLTNGLVPLIVLSSFGKSYKGNFFALVSFMQAGLLLVFMALDGFTFYVGWEAALIPIYFICALWGGGDRIRINLKFFIYTFFGSLLMLVALVFLYNQGDTRSLEWDTLVALQLPESTQRWIFWAFFLAFAIKIPIFPFHTWQPDTYTHAPAAGTMLLAGIMLKMGVYGLIRWLLPIAPFGVLAYSNVIMVLCVIGIVYASVIAFKQQDAKRLVAYSSIAHVGLISAGVISWHEEGLQGAIIQMVNHGLSVVGLFFIIDILQERTGSRNLSDLGGLAHRMPRLAAMFLIILMGAVGLPLTNGFIGEFLLLKGLFDYNLWYAAVGGLTLILGAVYMLRFYQKAMLGPSQERYIVADIRGHEVAVLAVIVFFTLFLGVWPMAVLHLSEASVTNLLNQIKF